MILNCATYKTEQNWRGNRQGVVQQQTAKRYILENLLKLNFHVLLKLKIINLETSVYNRWSKSFVAYRLVIDLLVTHWFHWCRRLVMSGSSQFIHSIRVFFFQTNRLHFISCVAPSDRSFVEILCSRATAGKKVCSRYKHSEWTGQSGMFK